MPPTRGAISRISRHTLEDVRNGAPVPFSDDIPDDWAPNDPDHVELSLCPAIGWGIADNSTVHLVTDALHQRCQVFYR